MCITSLNKISGLNHPSLLMSLSFYTPLASLLLAFFLFEHYQIESISKNCKLANVLISCLYNVVHMPCVERCSYRLSWFGCVALSEKCCDKMCSHQYLVSFIFPLRDSQINNKNFLDKKIKIKSILSDFLKRSERGRL